MSETPQTLTWAAYREFMYRVGLRSREYRRLHAIVAAYPTPEQRMNSPESAWIRTLAEEIKALKAAEYTARLPAVQVARCPYCDAVIRLPFDPFSLFGVHPLNDTTRSYATRGRQAVCKHMVTATVAVSLNGLRPDDLPTWMDHADWTLRAAPHLVPWLLTARHTRAVIHAVPIGRLDDPEFIPRYTAYFTVYFAAEDSNIQDDALWVGTEFGWAATEGVQIDEELSRWVAAGRLSWLEGPEPYRLVNSPAEAFPYGAVTPRGWYRIGPGGLVSDPKPFHLVYRGPALAHDDSLPRSFEL